MFKKYYIFSIGELQFLLHRKGYDKSSYDKLVLKTYKNEELEINVLTTKNFKDSYFVFGRSEKLVNILLARGVAREVRTILDSNDELTEFKLDLDLLLSIYLRSWEGRSYFEYKVHSQSNDRGYSMYLLNPPKEYINHPVVFDFEGEADEKGQPPKEVKDFITSKNTQKATNNLMSVVLFILIIIILGWLLI